MSSCPWVATLPQGPVACHCHRCTQQPSPWHRMYLCQRCDTQRAQSCWRAAPRTMSTHPAHWCRCRPWNLRILGRTSHHPRPRGLARTQRHCKLYKHTESTIHSYYSILCYTWCVHNIALTSTSLPRLLGMTRMRIHQCMSERSEPLPRAPHHLER